jgi:nucleotide-binding universal stress UspA family protein
MRVLFATDGSKDATAALAYLRSFPLPGDARVRVVTVADLPVDALTAERSGVMRNIALEHARGVADGAAANLKGRWPSTDAVVTHGDAREGIVRAAEDWSADLLVLGARGLSRARRLLIGSVSLGVARHAPCPVLVVKGKRRSTPPLLVAIDGSQGADRAVRFLSALPLRKTPVHLLGVVEPVRFPSTAPAAIQARVLGAIEDIQSERTIELKNALGRATAALRDTGATVVLSVRKGTSVAGMIVARAEAESAGLVVVGARGLGGIKRMLLGSVSEQVLRDAPCAVLVVGDGAAMP